MKKWDIQEKVEGRKSKVETEHIIALLLKNRGLAAKNETEEFLHPPDPYTEKGIHRSVRRL